MICPLRNIDCTEARVSYYPGPRHPYCMRSEKAISEITSCDVTVKGQQVLGV